MAGEEINRGLTTGSYFTGFALAAGVVGAGVLISALAMPRVEPPPLA